MTAAKGQSAQVRNTSCNGSASAREIAVVEDSDARTAEDLDRRDVVSEITGELGQAVSRPNAEMISLEGRGCIEAGSAARVWAVVPGLIPGTGLAAVVPGIVALGRTILSDRSKSEHKKKQDL